MLYQFPLPTWFEEGTTSRIVLIISLWIIIAALLGSVLGCWYFKPRSRIIWIIAETLWVLAFILMFLMAVVTGPILMARDAPVYLATTLLAVILFVTIPAAIAGINRLVPHPSAPRGFRDGRTWGCAIPFAIFLFFWLTLPTIGSPRESGRRSSCRNNLQRIGLAFHNYLELKGKFPDSQFDSDDSPPRSWRIEMLPFLEHQSEVEAYDQTQAWDSNTNQPVAKQQMREYICPSVPAIHQQDAQGRWYTAYATVNGTHTAFPNGKGLTPEKISDGFSNTVMVAEACGQQIVWTDPKDIETTATNIGINLPGNQPNRSSGIWSSYHDGQAFTLFADGSVRALNTDTDPQVLQAITTANGGEEVGPF